jgi:hypothetical protein
VILVLSISLYKLALASLAVSVGFTVPSWGMDDYLKKDYLVAVSTVVPQLVCLYVDKEDQVKFLQLNKNLRSYF